LLACARRLRIEPTEEAPMRTSLFALILLFAGPALAVEIQRSGPEVFPSKHELSAYLGYQAGVGGVYQNPSGLKITGEYAYRFHEIAWFDLQLGNVFGFGSTYGLCADSSNSFCYRGGWALDIAGGVKLKFKTAVPLVIEVPILLGVDVLYNRDCGDDGAAGPLLKAGANAKYFLTKSIGLGAALGFAFGPGFHGSSSVGSCKHDSYVDFYGAFDFSVVAEFLL
jgi:hypothetical protein